MANTIQPFVFVWVISRENWDPGVQKWDWPMGHADNCELRAGWNDTWTYTCEGGSSWKTVWSIGGQHLLTETREKYKISKEGLTCKRQALEADPTNTRSRHAKSLWH